MGPVQPTSSTGIQILERADALSRLSLDDEAPAVSLIRGFKATIPTSELSKQRRRLIRGGLVDEDLGGKLGLKALGDRARGLLTDGSDEVEAQHAAKRKDKRSRRKKLRERRSTMAHLEGKLHLEDLLQQADEIALDKDNLAVRQVSDPPPLFESGVALTSQSLINAEINEVSSKIEQLAEIRKRLEASLLKLQEEGLELDDELEGIQELMASPSVTSAAGVKALPPSAQQTVSSSSRRRKGPAFLPSEHDELPSGVAFLTLEGHTAPITALDYDEPYGTLVTAGQDDLVKVWDLCDGEVLGELRGHKGAVKAVQVEETLCVTGGEDGDVRLWDLRLVEDYEEKLAKAAESRNPLDRIAEEKEGSIRQGGEEEEERNPCVRTLEGHSKSITALYYEDSTLVTGSADKTIRQWDVTTGQCVQTMDILWAISNPPVIPLSPRKSRRKYSSSSYASAGYDDLLPSLDSPGAVEEPISLSGPFSVPTPPFSDGSWDMYTDFVGGLQSWGYALASGSGDGAVRMWDMRTGQAHRTLNGHTAPVTSLQFDEHNIISGSLDKTIRIWDMRMGQTVELHKYEYPVTCVQFDSRKVVACTGENGIEVYNRTTHEHSRLIVNGHTKPAERMRFIDKYLVSGGKDGTAKVWAM